MAIDLMPAARQAPGEFNNGAILEKRPVIFGQPGGGLHPYSNLFYWAHAWSDRGSTIGLHPHKGFEILSYVIKGTLEHYDTLLRKWIPLSEGSAQIIRSGNGVSHSEKLNAGAKMFQIWFDPDLRKSFGKKASYGDHPPGDFPKSITGGVTRTIIIGEGSPLKVDSNIRIERIDFTNESFQQSIPENWILSWFEISGAVTLNSKSVPAGDFARVRDEKKLHIDVKESGSAFLIFTPDEPGYPTYAENY